MLDVLNTDEPLPDEDKFVNRPLMPPHYSSQVGDVVVVQKSCSWCMGVLTEWNGQKGIVRLGDGDEVVYPRSASGSF